ncbi:MAG: type III pantothenate kinase [Acidimicrobiales bacterium]|nr:type III pantothenate kinase [Acidimicrobiales bacterium]
MLLAIDVGNTQTVIGLFAGPGDDFEVDGNRIDDGIESDLVDHWRIATQSERTSDELALVIQEFLGFHGYSFDDDIDGIAISSVVPRCTAAFREMTHKYFGFKPVVIEPGVKTGMPILTENPREVGADRIANAVGAMDLVHGPTIVIDFGTATTFDALSARGEYLGGAIAPGLDISLDALYTRAAALRRVELVEPRGVIGRTTVDSIQAGAIFGTAGMVDGICSRIAAELGAPTVIATGGLAALVAPYTKSISRVEPWLTLHGLRLVFQRNQT